MDNENQTEDRADTEAVDAQRQEEPLGDAGRRALESERKARKDAERQLGQLGQRVEALQRAEAERAVGDQLADPTDLWRADGVELSAMLGEDGNLDPERVKRTVEDVLGRKPHWRKAGPRVGGGADAGRGAPATTNLDSVADRLIRGR